MKAMPDAMLVTARITVAVEFLAQPKAISPKRLRIAIANVAHIILISSNLHLNFCLFKIYRLVVNYLYV